MKRTIWTSTVKPQVLSHIRNAGITNKTAIKKIVKFEKSILTTQNKFERGMDMESLCYTDAYNTAQNLLTELQQKHDGSLNEHTNDWNAYIKQANYANGLEIADFLA